MEELIVLLTPKFFIYLIILIMLFILVVLEKTTVQEIFDFFLHLFGKGSIGSDKNPSSD